MGGSVTALDRAEPYTDGLKPSRADLIAACDRICGGPDKPFHKDRCALYKANCEAMEALRCTRA
jgi:hypothetical protein